MRDFKTKLRKTEKTALFFTLLLLLLLGSSRISVGVAKASGEIVKQRNRCYIEIQKEPDNTIDVLVLGDSESYTTISPLQLWKNQGIPAFLCGQAGQKMQETYFMLRTALDTQSPKVVLLETHALFNREHSLGVWQSTLREAGNYLFPIFRMHDLWKAPLTGKRYSGKSYKGFEVRPAVQPYQGGEYMHPTEEKEAIPDYAVFYLKQMINLCRRNHAELVLYSGPSPVNYSYRRHNGLQELADSCGLAYIDLNLKQKELKIDWSKDTLDKGDHLNISGAEKVTAYMERYLKENYDLDDKRENEAYKDWNREAENFEKYCKIPSDMG